MTIRIRTRDEHFDPADEPWRCRHCRRMLPTPNVARSHELRCREKAAS